MAMEMGRMNGFPAHDYRDIMDLPPLEERPLQFSGKHYLKLLQQQNGEDLRGLTLAELERLPDADWTQAEVKKTLRQSIRQLLGRASILHPSQPGFSFDKCPDFFDGRSYLTALVGKYGSDLERLPPAYIGNLPLMYAAKDYYAEPGDEYLHNTSPAIRTDRLRAAHEFLKMPRVNFVE